MIRRCQDRRVLGAGWGAYGTSLQRRNERSIVETECRVTTQCNNVAKTHLTKTLWRAYDTTPRRRLKVAYQIPDGLKTTLRNDVAKTVA